MTANKWALIQSGQVLDKCDTIRQCMHTIKVLNPTLKAQVHGEYITDQLYEVKVKDDYYTILWIYDPK